MHRAPVGQTAVQAPQWVQVFSSRLTSWEAFCTSTPWDLRNLTPSLKFLRVPESSSTMYPSLRGSIPALRILKKRSKSLARWQTMGLLTSVLGNRKMSILEYTRASETAVTRYCKKLKAYVLWQVPEKQMLSRLCHIRDAIFGFIYF